ncbi:hypothetical protein [Limnohabitans radicicola]|uniref:hypothetical protein n=1 Tax=Limnohabitans radicicola TaxID=2771427 RepID=UPI00178327CD|nr:hypothetical protein [Limnohabitans radicicola]
MAGSVDLHIIVFGQRAKQHGQRPLAQGTHGRNGVLRQDFFELHAIKCLRQRRVITLDQGSIDAGQGVVQFRTDFHE